MSKCKYNIKTSGGFTLTEMAMVTTIIGLILIGITGGKALLEKSRVQSVIKDFNKYQAAISAFQAQYKYLPGDFPDASNFWNVGAFPPCTPAPAPAGCNGNGNGMIFEDSHEGEHLRAWQHLTRSEALSGSYTGAEVPVAFNMQVRINIPASIIKGAGYWFRGESIPASVAPFDKNRIQIGTYDGISRSMRGAVFTPQDARAIDLKMDNGFADTGGILATIGTPAAGSCVTGAAYDLDSPDKGCILVYNIKDGDNWN